MTEGTTDGRFPSVLIQFCDMSDNTSLGAVLAYVKKVMFWGIEDEGFAENLLLKIEIRRSLDGFVRSLNDEGSYCTKRLPENRISCKSLF